MKIGDKLRMVIETKYSKVSDFSAEIGFNYSQTVQYLNNKRNPSIVFLQTVIEKFPETDLNWLLKENDSDYVVNEPESEYGSKKNPRQIVADIESLLDRLKKEMPQE